MDTNLPPLAPSPEVTSYGRDANGGRHRRPGPEWVFAGLLAAFGLIFAFGIPPCQTPDEHSHFFRAYDVSQEHFTPQKMVGGCGAAVLPLTVHRVAGVFPTMIFHPEVKANWAELKEVRAFRSHARLRPATPYIGSINYLFVPYLPQAAGIALARKAQLDPLMLFYAGRLANLTVSVLLVFLAIRISPIFKITIGVFALLPITVQQMASYSPDASAIGVSFLMVAWILRLAVGPETRTRPAALVGMFGLASWLTLTKFPYASVTMLSVAIPSTRLGSRRLKVLTGIALAALVLGLFVVSARTTRRYAPDSLTLAGPTGEYKTSVRGQLDFVRHHPLDFLNACHDSCVEFGTIWLDSLFRLGWLDTPINAFAARLFFIFVVGVALLDQPSRVEIPALLKVAAVLAAGLAWGLVLSSLYTWWSPVGGTQVLGVQGRYMLPLLPLLPILLNHKAIRIEANPRALLLVTTTASVGMLWIAVAAFLRRYYFAERPLFLDEGISCSTALGVTGAAWIVSHYFPPVAAFGDETGPVSDGRGQLRGPILNSIRGARSRARQSTVPGTK
jgi:uncharacterized membrane protein